MSTNNHVIVILRESNDLREKLNKILSALVLRSRKQMEDEVETLIDRR